MCVFNLEDTVLIYILELWTALIPEHFGSDCCILDWLERDGVNHFSNDHGVLVPRQVLINRHVNDLSVPCTFNLLVLSNCHGHQLSRSLKSTDSSCIHFQLNNVVNIKWTKRFKVHASQSNIGVLDVSTEVDVVHVELVLCFVDEEGGVFKPEVGVGAGDVDIYVAVDRGDGDVVD